jgi:glucose/arabinose dehydrogenase
MKIFIIIVLLHSISLSAVNFKTTVFYSKLDKPWGMTFLPSGKLLVTEKDGKLKLIDKDGKNAVNITGVPKVFNRGQGGLLDVSIDPDFDKNQYVYFSFSEPAAMGIAGTAVARAKLFNNELKSLKIIWQQKPKVGGTGHWGSRLVFSKDKKLFITTGERYSFMDKAQDLSTHLGKTIRINRDGSIPKDNPYYGQKDKQQDIWSYGHRNMQGAFLHPRTGELWTHEHGPKGGDEINIDKAGKNYGWPVITYGIGYMGEKIGVGTKKKGMEQPLHYWVPSIAPSGMLYYTGKAFPEWSGNLFIGSLKYRYLNRVVIKNNKIIKEEKLLENLKERIRDIEQDEAGNIYVAIDNSDGKIYKISP